MHCFRVVQEIKRYWNPPVWRIWILGPCLNEELKHRHFSCFQIAPGVNHYLMCSFLLEIKGGTVFAREFYSCFLGRKRLLRIQSRAFMIQLGWHWLLFLFPQPFQILFSGLSFLILVIYITTTSNMWEETVFLDPRMPTWKILLGMLDSHYSNSVWNCQCRWNWII